MYEVQASLPSEGAMSWQIGQTLYRAVYVETGYLRTRDSEGEPPKKTYIDYDEYRVIRLTPKGGYIVPARNFREAMEEQPDCPEGSHYLEMWKSFGTKFVWTTKPLADFSLRERTKQYLSHSRRRLEQAEERARNLGVYTKNMLYAEAIRRHTS